MDCNFTKEDLYTFLQEVYDPEMAYNEGGMHTPDMFTLYLVLKRLQPEVVIESGVYNGFSTKLIRNTLGPDAIIVSLDPRPFDETVEYYKDPTPNTIYHMGPDFKDFESLDLSPYEGKRILAFFDDHLNQPRRALQCFQKNIRHLVFNDNYPVAGGSHYTFQHLFEKDPRFYQDSSESLSTDDQALLFTIIEKYHIFPNIFPSKIPLYEGVFECKSFLSDEEKHSFIVFWKEAHTYTWNTYLCLSAGC